MSSEEPTERLGYLLKHAWEGLTEVTTRALEPYGINGRELAVLLTFTKGGPASQHDAARRLGVDRTTMVALLDTLEDKGLVARRPDAADRRRNLVELTAMGEDTVRRATRAASDAERQFLSPLTPEDAADLKGSLRKIVMRTTSPNV